MSDFLDEKVQEIRSRLREIEPLVDEYNRLRAAMDALEAMSTSPTPASAPRATTSSRRGRSSTASRRGRRPAGEPTRADELVALVDGQPGITIAQAAKAMDVVPNGLYQVVAKLSEEGRIRKQGTGLFPTGGRGTAGAPTEASPDRQQSSEPAQPDEKPEPPRGAQTPADKPKSPRSRARKTPEAASGERDDEGQDQTPQDAAA
jgi:transposase-like protein